MKKIITTLAVLGTMAIPAVASADFDKVPTPVPVLNVTPGPGCMSHAAYANVNVVHPDWGFRFRFSNEHGNNTPPYDPALSSSDFKAACAD